MGWFRRAWLFLADVVDAVNPYAQLARASAAQAAALAAWRAQEDAHYANVPPLEPTPECWGGRTPAEWRRIDKAARALAVEAALTGRW